MGYRLYQSNRIEAFLEERADHFVNPDLFGPPLWFVVQNRNMGEWLKLRLTDLKGVSAGFTSLYPEQAIRQFSDHFDHPWRQDGREPRTVLFMDNLKIILYKKLEEIKKRRDSRYRLLLDFLDDETSLYEIANVLAGLFYRYGMNCFDLAAAWEEGRSIGLGGSAEAHESWQRLLWQELFGPEAPYILLSRILVYIREKELPYTGPQGKVILFGSSFLGDAGLNFFSYLSRYVDVEHYLFTPSRVFLTDSGENPLEEWEPLTTLIQGVSGFFKEKPPRDMVPDVGEKMDYPETLLGNLQQSLWTNRFPDKRELSLFAPPPGEDDSVRFFSCTGAWRQVEEARNAIIGLLRDDDTLQLTDIALMAPDINEFSPFIEALFQDENLSLPYNFIDLKNQSQSAYTDGFLSLLELPGGRFSRNDMFRLFRNPCFAQAFSLGEGEIRDWQEICRDTGILWGMDGEHLASMDLPPRENNRWERGFGRLLDGMVYESAEDRDNLPYVFPDESRNISVGKLIYIVRTLYQDFYGLNRQKAPLEKWIPRIEQLMEKYLAVRPDNRGDEGDRERIKAVFRNINNVMEGLDYLSSLPDPRMPWNVYRSLVLELIGKTGLRKGGYLTRGISCSSLKPLRAVPFRVVILLGMDYGRFPGSDEEFSFDLTELARPSVDLSRRAGDRFSFLEAFLSAREKFWVFYTGRSHVSGETLHPSPVISELSDIVEKYKEAFGQSGDDLYIPMPLQPYDSSRFEASRVLPSFDLTAYEQARVLRDKGKSGVDGTVAVLPERENPEEIDMRDLINFFRNPLGSFGRKSLRIFHREEGDEEEEILDPVDPAPFEDVRFYEEIIGRWCDRGPLSPDSLDSLAQEWWSHSVKTGHLSGSGWDRPSFRQLLNSGESLLGGLNGIDRALWEGGVPRERRFMNDVKEETAGHTRYLSAVETESRLGPVSLTGETEPLYGGEILGSARYCYGKKEKTKDLFAPFLSHLFLTQREGQGYYGRQVLLAGSGFSRLTGWTSQTVQRGEYFQPVPEPEKILAKLTDLYLRNLTRPLPFYPSLIDEAAELINKGKLERSNLPREWPYLWKKALSRDQGYFDLKNCPYRDMLMPEGPVWDEGLDILFDDIVPYLL